MGEESEIMKIVFSPEDDDLTRAYKALDRLLKRYDVELCASQKTDFWFEKRETKKPELKVV
jgi:hypothetical protein